MIRHLTIRVPWHDMKWNGHICTEPSRNSFCLALDRIRAGRDDLQEDHDSGVAWADLEPSRLPPCIAENGGFMNDREWRRVFDHPYQQISKASSTHGHLNPTTHTVPEYAALAVPFWHMLKTNQDAIQSRLKEQLPEDEVAPFSSPWVFGRARQEVLLEHVFNQLVPERSLALFYTKEGQPVSESINRLVVGVGRILSVGQILRYISDADFTYPLWERIIRHSIRPTDSDGFLLPYHSYLEPTGDEEEDFRRLELLEEITVTVEQGHVGAYSYAAQLAGPDAVLSTLVKVLQAVRSIRRHGIAKGPWEQREDWVNAQMAKTWRQRGAFPGAGAVLEALGLRLGTSLYHELSFSNSLSPDENPWPLLDKILRGDKAPPQPAYLPDLASVRKVWSNLTEERRDLLTLLSRFDLTPKQADRWFSPRKRHQATRSPLTDDELLSNPYKISEADLGDSDDGPVSIGVIDRGLLPDDTIRIAHPVPEPSHLASPQDWRRVRASLASVLRAAGEQGDSLLSTDESLERVADLDISPSVDIGQDWINAHSDELADVIRVVNIESNEEDARPSLQLLDHFTYEDRLSKVLAARAKREITSPNTDWRALLDMVLGDQARTSDERHREAIKEQIAALKTITSRRTTVLTGRAGTGKTTVLAALLQCEEIAQDGVLLLAPTGKARVRLSTVTKSEAMTIAQFLYHLGRYDGPRQRTLHEGESRHRKQKTVVIDECSMLTLDTLHAIIQAIDMAHVERLILVGDPNQLPPIGVGRPFADFIAFLNEEIEQDGHASGALAKLTVEVRATQSGPSDTLRLAAWFTNEQQPADADRVLSDLRIGTDLNDLEVVCWNTPEELRSQLLERFQKHLPLSDPNDVAGFNLALGLDENGRIEFDNPKGIDNFQVLSPIHMHPHGVFDLNRWIQTTFRKKELERGRGRWGKTLGDEEIVAHDKVMQVVNQRKDAYSHAERTETTELLANGEIGLVAYERKGWFNVVFSERPHLTFGYLSSSFSNDSAPLTLAYALTIHKAQGSEFEKVFVVVPKGTRLLSRELVYTAMTRSRQQLVLLVEGDDPSLLFDLTKPEKSETGLRNSNLFFGAVRAERAGIPFAEHLIHRTLKGHLVRSKSELVIANELYHQGLDYDYERLLSGEDPNDVRLPDFSFTDYAGDVIVWEHLGMLSRPTYRRSWERKKEWYRQKGFEEGDRLFVTYDDDRGGLDASEVKRVARQIQERI